MSDGMMEAHRDTLRSQAERDLYGELLQCAADPARPTDQLMAMAKETDEIRGGMVGTTCWTSVLPKKLERLRSGDEPEWMRFLHDLWREGRVVTIAGSKQDAYAYAKQASPFASELIVFGHLLTSPDLSALAKQAGSSRYGYVLEVHEGKIRMRSVREPSSLDDSPEPRLPL